MSKKEFEKLNKSQLESKLKDYKESLLNYRFQKVLQQLEDPFKIRFTRKFSLDSAMRPRPCPSALRASSLNHELVNNTMKIQPVVKFLVR